MQSISSPSNLDKQNRLRRLRYFARKRGFRVARAPDGFSLVAVGTEPPRVVSGLGGVSLEALEAALGLARTREDQAPIQFSDAEAEQLITGLGLDRAWRIFDTLTAPQGAPATK
jgi:hypothetical protein